LLATPRPNVSLGSLRQKSLPRGFEIGAGFVESWRRFRPDVRLGVSPDRNRNAVPTVFVMRVAAADRDRTASTSS